MNDCARIESRQLLTVLLPLHSGPRNLELPLLDATALANGSAQMLC